MTCLSNLKMHIKRMKHGRFAEKTDSNFASKVSQILCDDNIKAHKTTRELRLAR